MDWYKGGIPAAIQQAKGKGIIFLVYITGVDDMSKKMDETWNDSSVHDACKDNCIGIRLDAKSTDCVQFSQIYPVVCVPSTFLIGTDGVPKEILGGHYEPQVFVQKLQLVFQTNQASEPPAESFAPVSSPESTLQSASASSISQTAETPVKEADTPVAEGASTSEVTAASISTGQPSETPLEEAEKPSTEGASAPAVTAEVLEADKQAKLERAQKLIEMKREQKAKEEAEKQRNDEKQRRHLGKETAKLKQWQEDKNRQETVETWKKEKDEAKLAREKVREQIAHDRAERAMKFQKDKEDREEMKEQKKKLSEVQAAEAKAKTDAMKRETARLQFRLPDGSNITETFASSETLGTAKVFLNAKVGNSYGNYTLRAIYPKREFTSVHMSSTLLDLELTPSAALVVIPGSKMSSSFLGGDNTGSQADNNSTGGGGGGSGGILMLILSPLFLLWNFIYNLLFGTPDTLPPPQPQRNPIPTPAESSPVEGSSGGQSEGKKEEDTALRNRSKVLKSGLTSRQEGNVRRFTADQDDDDMTVYNGNSTQQM